jgi:hypothetical protein
MLNAKEKYIKQNNNKRIIKEQIFNLNKKPRFIGIIHNETNGENLFNFCSYYKLLKNKRGLIVNTPNEIITHNNE